jgi:hypothetical protein
VEVIGGDRIDGQLESAGQGDEYRTAAYRQEGCMMALDL